MPTAAAEVEEADPEQRHVELKQMVQRRSTYGAESAAGGAAADGIGTAPDDGDAAAASTFEKSIPPHTPACS